MAAVEVPAGAPGKTHSLISATQLSRLSRVKHPARSASSACHERVLEVGAVERMRPLQTSDRELMTGGETHHSTPHATPHATPPHLNLPPHLFLGRGRGFGRIRWVRLQHACFAPRRPRVPRARKPRDNRSVDALSLPGTPQSRERTEICLSRPTLPTPCPTHTRDVLPDASNLLDLLRLCCSTDRICSCIGE